jgi:hypothetical protein
MPSDTYAPRNREQRSDNEEVSHMTARITQSTVHFGASFSLTGVDEMLPPGDYAISEDEELIEGPSWIAYRRVGTFICLTDVSLTSVKFFAVDHSELETAQRQDQQNARRVIEDRAE